MKLLSLPVIGHAAEIAKDLFSKAELEIVFMKAGLDGFMALLSLPWVADQG